MVVFFSEVCSPASVASKKHRLLQSLEPDQQAPATSEANDVTQDGSAQEQTVGAPAEGDAPQSSADNVKVEQEKSGSETVADPAVNTPSESSEQDNKDLNASVTTESEMVSSQQSSVASVDDDATAQTLALEAAKIKHLASELLKAWKELKVKGLLSC